MSKALKYLGLATGALLLIIVSISTFAQSPLGGESSYSPVVIKESFEAIMARMKAAKPGVMKRQMDLLNERYDLSNRPATGVTMSRGKPVQDGVRAKLPAGMTWERLAGMSPEEIREKGLFPAGFFPLPTPTIRKVACSFPSSILRRLRSKKVGISPALIWILICRTTFYLSSQHLSI